MATGIEGYLQIKILDGHKKFMVTSEFWAKVARDFNDSRFRPDRIETVIGPETKALDTGWLDGGNYETYQASEDDASESPCPHCAYSHRANEKCPTKRQVAPLFQNERKRIYDLETELNTLRKNNAPKSEINAKIKEIDRVING
ncbi:MAG: hypothetical protein M0R80_04050 [Proteobacteria bacterium]|jgi:hypothetical protein|nr:hypothetical protein [Pseudomonadota bacterium]